MTLPEDVAAALQRDAAGLFDELRQASFDGTGITRECYADGENRALEIFRSYAQRNGLVAQTDVLGHLIVRSAADDGSQSAVYLGSHADSVPQGGNYDGAAGIVAGLLCLRAVGDQAGGPIRVIALRGEESAFYGRANIGSRALFGQLTAKDLEAKRLGGTTSLEQAMAGHGLPLDQIRQGEAFAPSTAFRAYLELHIEQGPVMVARSLPAAIVTGIRGNYRHRSVRCLGEAGHSGTVPRWLRKDAVFALAELVGRLDEHWRKLLEQGLDAVVTVGIVATDAREHAISRIPGCVEFSFEVRSQSQRTLDDYYSLFRRECDALARERGVSFALDDRVDTEPATMNPAIVETLRGAALAEGLDDVLIASGAGHDAAVFANAGVPSGMVFVRNRNGSHNPHEAMDLQDFMSGVRVLVSALGPLRQ